MVKVECLIQAIPNKGLTSIIQISPTYSEHVEYMDGISQNTRTDHCTFSSKYKNHYLKQAWIEWQRQSKG